jgi:hypothetical protein
MHVSAFLACAVVVAAQGDFKAEPVEDRPDAEAAVAEAEAVDEAAAGPSADGDADASQPDELTDDEAAAAAEAAAATALAGDVEKKGPERLVAVLDLKHAEESAPVANALAQVITSDVGARDDLKAISRNEIMSILAHQAEASMMGCEELSCMADIAKLVAADLLVTGTIDKVDDGALVVTLSLIDPSEPKVLERTESAWRGDPAEIVLVARPMIDRLLAGPDKTGLIGGLEIFTEDGAVVAIDGEERGTAPLEGPITGLSSGVHVITLEKEGFVPARRDVVVETGQTAISRVSMEAEPYYTQWWFWTAVGGGAAVAIAGGTAIAIAAVQGDTTVNIKLPAATGN